MKIEEKFTCRWYFSCTFRIFPLKRISLGHQLYLFSSGCTINVHRTKFRFVYLKTLSFSPSHIHTHTHTPTNIDTTFPSFFRTILIEWMRNGIEPVKIHRVKTFSQFISFVIDKDFHIVCCQNGGKVTSI